MGVAYLLSVKTYSLLYGKNMYKYDTFVYRIRALLIRDKCNNNKKKYSLWSKI